MYTLFRGSCFLFQFFCSSSLSFTLFLLIRSLVVLCSAFATYTSFFTVRFSVCVCVFQCFDLDKFEGVSTEAVLVEQSFKLLNQDRFWAGLVFTDLDPADPRTPPHIRYKIRMDIGDTERTDKIKERSEPNTQDHNINT